MLGSKTISQSLKPKSFKILYERLHISIFLSKETPCPFSSNAITTTAAPYFFIILAFAVNFSSPSFRLMEFTIGFPAIFLSAVSIVLKSDESIITGTFETTGSFWTTLKYFSISSYETRSPSSIFISITEAPFSICIREISKALV